MKITNREAHEEAAGYNLEDAFFRLNGIDPNAEYNDREKIRVRAKHATRKQEKAIESIFNAVYRSEEFKKFSQDYYTDILLYGKSDRQPDRDKIMAELQNDTSRV